MAMAHPAMTQDPMAASAARKEAPQSKRNFVPIRPAFRPLLPKPCNREPAAPNGIHIHTRATLSVGRKRLCPSKPDAHKRRKPAGSQPLHTKIESKHEDLDAQDVRRSESSTPVHSPAINMSVFNNVDVSVPGSESANSAATPRSLEDSILSKKMSAASLPQLSMAPSTSSLEDLGTPATPSSLNEYPTAVSTASIFGPPASESVTPTGTIDPVSIAIEGDELDLNGTGTALPALPQLESVIDTAVLTPPESQKSVGLSAFSAYGGSGEFDEFSDFYFRNENSTVDNIDNAQQPLVTDSLTTDKDDDFSILEYLAPTVDLF